MGRNTLGYGFHRYDYLGKLAYKFSENVSLRTMANAFDNQEKGLRDTRR